MGGTYHPIVEGNIDGLTNGLQSDLDLYRFSKKLNLKNNKEVDYWMGFGAGYQKGQSIRELMKNVKGQLSFEEYISCCVYLHKKSHYCNQFQNFVDHVSFWDLHTLDPIVAKEAILCINQNQLQRGLILIWDYCKSNYLLHALIEIDKLAEELKRLRHQKRENPGFDILPFKDNIAKTFRNWISAQSRN